MWQVLLVLADIEVILLAALLNDQILISGRLVGRRLANRGTTTSWPQLQLFDGRPALFPIVKVVVGDAFNGPIAGFMDPFDSRPVNFGPFGARVLGRRDSRADPLSANDTIGLVC